MLRALLGFVSNCSGRAFASDFGPFAAGFLALAIALALARALAFAFVMTACLSADPVEKAIA